MKIIIANPYLSLSMGGGAILPRQMAHSLKSLGIDVTLLGLSLELSTDKTGFLRTEIEGIPSYMAPTENFLRYGHYPNYGLLRPNEPLKRAFARLLDESGVDLVHCISLIGLGPLVEAAFERLIPCVYTTIDFGTVCLNQIQLYHDGTGYIFSKNGERCAGPNASKCLICQKMRFSWPLFFLGAVMRYTTMRGWRRILGSTYVRLAENLTRFPLADYLVPMVADAREYMHKILFMLSRCVSPSPAAREALERAGFPREQISDIVYGIADEALLKRKRRPGLPLQDRDLFIGYFGSIAKHKGVHVLIDAFCQIALENRVCLMLCVSGGHGVEDLLRDVRHRGTARQLIASDRIQIYWNCANEEYFKHMAEVDVSVIPTLVCEWPLVLLESLAQGTPCIVSEGHGMSHIVRPGISGECFEQGSVEALSQVILGLLRTPEQIGCWRKNLFIPYSQEQYARSLSGLYGNLLKAEM